MDNYERAAWMKCPHPPSGIEPPDATQCYCKGTGLLFPGLTEPCPGTVTILGSWSHEDRMQVDDYCVICDGRGRILAQHDRLRKLFHDAQGIVTRDLLAALMDKLSGVPVKEWEERIAAALIRWTEKTYGEAKVDAG